MSTFAEYFACFALSERIDIETRFTWSNIISAGREKRKRNNDDRQGMKPSVNKFRRLKTFLDPRYDKGHLAVFKALKKYVLTKIMISCVIFICTVRAKFSPASHKRETFFTTKNYLRKCLFHKFGSFIPKTGVVKI